MKPIRSSRRQEGAILVITLIMLVLITLLTVSTLRSTTMDERMAGNSRDREKAQQAAEAATRACLDQVTADPMTYPTAKILTPVAAPGTNNWDNDATWTASGTDVTMSTAGLAANPRCLVEDLNDGTYRVTGRAVGGSDLSVVMIQATYTAE